MPTYRNDTSQRITHRDKGYMTWNPGEVKALGFFVPHKELGLTLASPLPKVCENTALGYWEEKIAAQQRVVIELPYYATFDLSVSAPNGAVKMYIGDSDIPIMVEPLHDHVSARAWDMTAYLTFEGVSKESTLFVKMEARFAGENKRR